ncbi:MAG TPA: cell division protein SepF [Acidimicrobiales bacterium]|jgi:cell division inhibitor SepF|nr:cell division protein SepF [Acidimicrobiales bacterium]
MATMWRKAMLYLGLGPDEEYDDYEPGYEPPASRGYDNDSAGLGGRYSPSSYPPDEPSSIGAVRPINPTGGVRDTPSVVTVQPSGQLQPQPRPRPQVVRPLPAPSSAKPVVVVPTSFNQAQEVADKFKGNQPVIVNLQGADRELSRRLIDFGSGLCYGLGGHMEKVANQVYLLTPVNVEVPAEERRRLEERGFDR